MIRHLIEWLSGDEHERVRRSFEQWLKRRLRARMAADTMTDPGLVPTLEEIETMFPDLLIREERKRARKEGWAEGREEGRAAGLQEGLQQGERKGMRLGQLEGMQAGEQKAARVALLHLLERRFGPVSPEIQKQIEAAEYGALQQWFDRAIDADGIGQVFGGHSGV